MKRDEFLEEAIAQAKKSLTEGGIPIGAVLVRDGKIIGKGHNTRVQTGSPIFHAEMAAVENAGRLPASAYRECTLYSTLSPCVMCSGMMRLYKIPNVVVGEDINFQGPAHELRAEGITVNVVNDAECVEIMKTFIEEHPDLWYEDIGENG